MDHEVQPQEGITSISEQYGFNDLTIWNHVKNKKIRDKRPDLNNLMVGDKVFIPERQVKSIECETQKTHRFKRRGIPALYRVQLFEEGGPRANQDYIFDVDGTKHKGTTDKVGVLKEFIPAGSKQGQLIIGKDQYQLDISFGALAPATENLGIQQRLIHFGYFCGELIENGELNEETLKAIKHVQTILGLTVTGELSDETREAIVNIHDSINNPEALCP